MGMSDWRSDVCSSDLINSQRADRMAANAMKPPAASIPSPGLVMLAGAAGFEPAHAGTKNRCLTAWLRPNTSGRAGSKRRPYTQAAPAGKGFFVPFPQKTSVGTTVHQNRKTVVEGKSVE